MWYQNKYCLIILLKFETLQTCSYMIKVEYISYIFISGGFGVLYNLPSEESHLNIQYVEKVIFLICAAASIDRFVRLISQKFEW